MICGFSDILEVQTIINDYLETFMIVESLSRKFFDERKGYIPKHTKYLAIILV